MKLLVKILIVIVWCVPVSVAKAQAQQVLTLEECYKLSKLNYPLIQQRRLIEKSNGYTVQNIANSSLPQVNFSGQATYQSEVTQIPVKIPGMDLPEISKDQYKLYGEVTQSVYDGGLVKAQKNLQEANTLAEQQKLEIELYALKERINQVFFGILLADEQLQQTELLKKDIRAGLTKTNAAIEFGIALKSSADILKAELLKADQHTIELQASRQAYLKILGLFVDQSLDKNTKLIKPERKAISHEIQRPELLLFNYQQKSLDAQRNIIDAKNRPKVNLFLQGGIGRPALNFLSNDLAAYYITGLRLGWPVSGLYNAKNEKALLSNNQKSIDVQKETFLFNTQVSLSQETEEVQKINALLETDDELIALRNKVKNAALAQLENGVITGNDYIQVATDEDVARQNKTLHEIQLLLAEYNHMITSGN